MNTKYAWRYVTGRAGYGVMNGVITVNDDPRGPPLRRYRGVTGFVPQASLSDRPYFVHFRTTRVPPDRRLTLTSSRLYLRTLVYVGGGEGLKFPNVSRLCQVMP